MTKLDFIRTVAKKTGLTQKDTNAAVEAVFETITEALKDGEKISVNGFGCFYVKERPARTGINPRTKETIKIEASKIPAFKAAAALKSKIK